MNWLKNALGLIGAAKEPKTFDPVAPDAAFVAVGDIHGRLDLLTSLIQRIEEKSTRPKLVFVGDYIDRGPDSAGVLRFLHQLTLRKEFDVTCLMGNHEKFLLSYLDAPGKNARNWFRNGGLQTLESFGVRLSDEPKSQATCDALKDAMGEDLIHWIREMPKCWISGNVVVAHAGLNPHDPPETQKTHDLLWGHSDFRKITRKDGKWVVHGHIVVEKPSVTRGVISIDTGAYLSGKLTAAEISEGNVNFILT